MKNIIKEWTYKIENNKYAKYMIFTLIFGIFIGKHMYNMAAKLDSVATGGWDGFGDPLYFFTIFLHISVLLKSIFWWSCFYCFCKLLSKRKESFCI